MSEVQQAVAKPMTLDERTQHIMDTTGLPHDLVADFRFATFLARSTIIPTIYRNQEANCYIAISTARMLKLDPFFVMCGTFVYEGKLCWFSKHLQVVFKMRMGVDIDYDFDDSDKENLRCRASATIGGKTKSGPWISQKMATDSGWASKLWKSSPELMLHYRSAAWMINMKFPEVLCGLSIDHDLEDANPSNSLTVTSTNVTSSSDKAAAFAARLHANRGGDL